MSEFGKTLFIVNPSAKNGHGLEAVPIIEKAFAGHDFEIAYTEYEKHAKTIAYEAQGFDTIVSVGGDGNAHDTANGILARPEGDRPAFTLLPMGSGNDYARTLCLPLDVARAAEALSTGGRRARLDCGRCGEEFFHESVSFGIDAAIAIGTIELRKKTGGSGTSLYMQSGFDVIANHYRTYPATYALDGRPANTRELLLFCVTIGKTYGGGFIINPHATGQDGVLHVVTATYMPRAKALGVFVLASKGKHTRFKDISFAEATHASVDYPFAPPTQFDGEPQYETHYELELLPHGIEVIVPGTAPLDFAY